MKTAKELSEQWAVEYYGCPPLVSEFPSWLEKRLRAVFDQLPKTVHERRCRDCGHVGLHADNIMPYVLCPKCGSQDTRATKRRIHGESA